jgi:hypothetical protein
MTKPVQVEAKHALIHMKVRDEFCCSILDQSGESLKEYEGYVPEWMPDDVNGTSHFGDYLILKVDLDTGQIVNWKQIGPGVMEKFIADKDGA